MYLNFYDLQKEPFQITPDPSFLFLSHVHKEALASIIYGVEKRKGFVLITGAVGVGKTTILRAYLEKAEARNLRIIYVFNSNISYSNLLKYVFSELDIVPQSGEICHMVNQLHQKLLDEYREGRNVLLLIDEAQNMPIDTLENLRMLSNFETATEKLIQIVFSAQPEFEKTLNLDELKQLKQRIAVKATIYPFSTDEGVTYIHHRLKTAGHKEKLIFSDGALKEIVKAARGIPRVINVLCDNSLITAFGYGKKRIGVGIVREITRDFGLHRPLYMRYGLYLLIAGLLAIGTVGIATLKRTLPTFPRHSFNMSPAARPEPIPKRGMLGQADAKASVTRVVQKGDTLAKLIKEVYGRVDAERIKQVKEANPNIVDENLILEGGVISFPR